jgi:hypothetical protein
METSGQLHAPVALPPATHWLGGWVVPVAGGGEKNSQPLSGLEPFIFQLVLQSYTTALSRYGTKLIFVIIA